jgi:hypothetical protein
MKSVKSSLRSDASLSPVGGSPSTTTTRRCESRRRSLREAAPAVESARRESCRWRSLSLCRQELVREGGSASKERVRWGYLKSSNSITIISAVMGMGISLGRRRRKRGKKLLGGIVSRCKGYLGLIIIDKIIISDK